MGVFCKKGKEKVFLGVFEISRKKHLSCGLFLKKMSTIGPESLLKKDSSAKVSCMIWETLVENRLHFIGLTQI